MNWLSVNKAALATDISVAGRRYAPVCQWIIGILISAIITCTSPGPVGFIFTHVSGECAGLDVGAQNECLPCIQMELLKGLLFCLVGIFILKIICVVVSEIAEKHLGAEILKLESKCKKLEKEKERFQALVPGIGSVIKVYFDSVAKRCGLGVDERVSFYVLEKKGRLYISDRHAANPEYQCIRRESYSVKEGIISLARKRISVQVEGLPDYMKEPDRYIAECQAQKFNLSPDVIRNLTMKARFYYAYRFSSADQQSFNSIVVIESMDAHFRNQSELDKVFSADNDFIYNIVKAFRTNLPKLKISRERSW